MSENPNSWTLSEDIRKEREKNKIKANTFKFNADYSENNFLSHLSNADSVEKESKINTAEIPKTGSIFGGFGHGLTAKPFSDSLKSNFSEEHNNERGKSVENEDEATRKERDKQERDRLFWRRAAMHSSEFSPITASNPLSNVAKSNQLNQRFSRPLLENSAYKSPFAAGSSNSRPSWPRFGDPVADPPKHMELVASGRSFSQDRDGNKCLWNFDKNDFEKPMSSEEIALLNKILHKKLVNLQYGPIQIHQSQSDPSSPLYSANTFESLRLKDELLKALHKMGFLMPSKIQEAALPLLLTEPPQNMIAQSQSGTGKTAAFVLTMLSRVVPGNHWPQCICLAPTFELAMQIGEVVKNMSCFMPEIKIRFAVRGEKMTRGETIVEQIIIGTPGIMLDWVLKMKVIDPSKIICMVFDEADVMISQQGHMDQSIRLHNELKHSGAKYQSLLFSATYDDSVFAFAESIIKEAVLITVRREEQTLKNIKQYYVRCANREEKCEAVINLYGGLTIASAIIFCYTRTSAEWLANRMAQRGHEVSVLHGAMSIENRAKIIQDFKDGVFKVLVTTNVCARGIDVCQVSVVINYDPPVTHFDSQPDYETYLHRIGRTGRFGKAGIAINLVSDDFSLNVIERIAEHFGKKIELLDASDMDQLEAIDRD